MTTENDLVVAMKESLEQEGALKKFKAQMRAMIMNVLKGDIQMEKPKLSDETLLINELIRDYMTWNGYKYTESIFIEESGLNEERMPRCKILEDIGVTDSEETSKFAILHGLLIAFKEYVKALDELA